MKDVDGARHELIKSMDDYLEAYRNTHRIMRGLRNKQYRFKKCPEHWEAYEDDLKRHRMALHHFRERLMEMREMLKKLQKKPSLW